MRDPADMPARSIHRFVCIDLETGHIRNRKDMTAELAARINTYDHMQDTPYKWLWDDQYDFKDQLDYSSAIVIKA